MRKYSLALTAVALLLALYGVAYAGVTKLYGEISAIDYTAKTLEVAGTTVYATDCTTVIIAGEVATFDGLQVGQTVQVVGTIIDGQFIAKRICVQGGQNRYRDQAPRLGQS